MGTVECPVCTLYLHAGMSLEIHLETHPKEKVIQALVAMAMQNTPKLNTNFSQHEPINKPPQNTITYHHKPHIQPQPVLAVTNTPEQPPPIIKNVTQTEVFGNESSSVSYMQNPVNNLMIVKSCSTKYIQQMPTSSFSTSEAYIEHDRNHGKHKQMSADNSALSLYPRYTNEMYSGPPPPYSTAISSTISNSQQSNISNAFPTKSSTESQWKTTDPNYNHPHYMNETVFQAQYTEKDDGNFIVTENPTKVVEYTENDEGKFMVTEKIIRSPQRVLNVEDFNDDNQGVDNDDSYQDSNKDDEECDESMDNKSDDHSFILPGMSSPENNQMRNKFNFIVNSTPLDPNTNIMMTKKSTSGLKVLSNVKVTTDLSQGIKDIILNLNCKKNNENIQTPKITPTKLPPKQYMNTVNNNCKNELIINSGNNMPLIDLDNVNDIEIINDDDDDDEYNQNHDCYTGSMEVKASVEDNLVESIIEPPVTPPPVTPPPASVITSVIRMTPHPPELQIVSTVSDDEDEAMKTNNKTAVTNNNLNIPPPSTSKFSPSPIKQTLDQPTPTPAPAPTPTPATNNKSIGNNNFYKKMSIFNKPTKKLTLKLKTPLPPKESIIIDESKVAKLTPIAEYIDIKNETEDEIRDTCHVGANSSTDDLLFSGEAEIMADDKTKIEITEDELQKSLEIGNLSNIDYAGHNLSTPLGQGVDCFKITFIDDKNLVNTTNFENTPENLTMVSQEVECNNSNTIDEPPLEEDEKKSVSICQFQITDVQSLSPYAHQDNDNFSKSEAQHGEQDMDTISERCEKILKSCSIKVEKLTKIEDEKRDMYGPSQIDRKDFIEAGPSRSDGGITRFAEYTTECEEYMQTNNYLPQEQIPLSWVQKFSPQYTPFDDQNSYMDLDLCSKNNSNSAGGSGSVSRIDSIDRAPSAESLNIRTDEKMPAKGEISEQESNGEIELSWNRVYTVHENMPIYPSSYDMSTAQECWNLSSRNSHHEIPHTMNFQIISQPMQSDENEEMKSKIIPIDLDDKSKLSLDHDPIELDDRKSKPRTYRCVECPKSFALLKQRRAHMLTEHEHLESHKMNHLSSAIASSSTSKYKIPSLSYPKIETATSNSYEGCSNSSSAGMLNKKIKMETIPVLMSYSSLKQELEMKQENLDAPIELRKKKTYVCGMCKVEFVSFKLFNQHLMVHPAECYACGRCFKHWPNFALHIKRHLGIKDHQCRLCNKKFVIRQKLIEHMRIHTGNAPIKCPDCDQYFRRYSNLAQHRNRHHLNKVPSKKDFVCHCGEVFQSKAKVEWHKEIHENKPKSCPHCREKFIHKNSLTRHMRLSHTDKYIKLEAGTEMCPICKKPYIKTSLKRHMETHTEEKLGFSCTICNKRFSTNWNLKQHKWTHANPTSKPFQCNLCSNAFVREADYITHMNAHKSIRPYTCNYCGCQFIRKYNWLRHTREHETDKNYACDVCGRKFHRKYYLTEHKRIHTGERPFSCNICGKTSSTKTNHNKHIKIHHARDPLTAEG